MKKIILLALLVSFPLLAETKVRDSIRLGGPINVKDKGCVGDDVADDTACLATVQGLLVANQTVIFPAGTYKYTASPNWNARNVHLVGAGSSLTTLHFTGTGNAVVFDGGAVVGEVTGATMQGFLVKGNASATNGLFLRSVHHSTFRDVRVHDVAASCLLINFAVVDTFDTFRCSVNEGSAFATRPVNGILIDKRGALEAASANTFINPIIEGVSGSGIKLVSAAQNVFLGGTSEGNDIGIELAAASVRNVFSGMDLEVNATKDAVVASDFNAFYGMLIADGGGGTHGLHVTGNNNIFHGGLYTSAQIDAGAKANEIDFAFNGSGVVDNGTDTKLVRLWNNNSTIMGGIPWSSRDTVPAIPWTGLGTPDKQDLLAGAWTFTTTPTVISNTVVTAAKPWRILFIGVWGNNTEGGALQQIAPIMEATTAAPTLTIGTVTVTVSVNGSSQFSVVTGANTAAFSGRILPISNNQGLAGAASINLKGSAQVGQVTISTSAGPGTLLFSGGLTNGTLGTPGNGTVVYCSDCTIANPCAGGGTGALAKRLAGVWVCN